MGIGAHALDELNGRPLRTRIPAACSSRSPPSRSPAACAIGVVVATRLDAVAARVRRRSAAFVVVAYNLELFGGAFHSDLWFAARLGRVPRC